MRKFKNNLIETILQFIVILLAVMLIGCNSNDIIIAPVQDNYFDSLPRVNERSYDTIFNFSKEYPQWRYITDSIYKPYYGWEWEYLEWYDIDRSKKSEVLISITYDQSTFFPLIKAWIPKQRGKKIIMSQSEHATYYLEIK